MLMLKHFGWAWLAMCLGWSGAAGAAEGFPTHAMRIVVPFAAGGAVDVLARISTRIINQVGGVNRVVYDISSKPPAAIKK